MFEFANGSLDYRIFAGEESVAHPSARSPVTANVRKSFLVIAIRRTERHLLDRLVHDQTLINNNYYNYNNHNHNNTVDAA